MKNEWSEKEAHFVEKLKESRNKLTELYLQIKEHHDEYKELQEENTELKQQKHDGVANNDDTSLKKKMKMKMVNASLFAGCPKRYMRHTDTSHRACVRQPKCTPTPLHSGIDNIHQMYRSLSDIPSYY